MVTILSTVTPSFSGLQNLQDYLPLAAPVFLCWCKFQYLSDDRIQSMMYL